MILIPYFVFYDSVQSPCMGSPHKKFLIFGLSTLHHALKIPRFSIYNTIARYHTSILPLGILLYITPFFLDHFCPTVYCTMS